MAVPPSLAIATAIAARMENPAIIPSMTIIVDEIRAAFLQADVLPGTTPQLAPDDGGGLTYSNTGVPTIVLGKGTLA